MRRVKLFHDFSQRGHALEVTEPKPFFDPEFDKNILSFKIYSGSTPVFFWDGYNYTGEVLQLNAPGECNDLIIQPKRNGNWRNSLKSISFYGGLLTSTEKALVGVVEPTTEEERIEGEKINQLLKASTNPSFADAGCVNPDGRRTAFFRTAGIVPKKGDRLNIVIANPTFENACENGRPASMEDLSMTVDDWHLDPGNPFAKLMVTGYP